MSEPIVTASLNANFDVMVSDHIGLGLLAFRVCNVQYFFINVQHNEFKTQAQQIRWFDDVH